MNRRTWLSAGTALLAVFALLSLAGAANASFPTANPGPQTVANAPAGNSDMPFDCSQIKAHGIDKQMNLRASQILADCGYKGADTPAAGPATTSPHLPNAYGGVDQNVHPSNSAAIQSETFIYGDGANTLVVAYNDLSGGSTGKGSVSTDQGNTWARIAGDPFGTGHGSDLGDPASIYSVRAGKWVVMFLATGCGGQGIGTWTSTNGLVWATGPCAANATSGNGDRNSAWVDNNAASPNYGYMYASYNDFGAGGGALKVARSTDDGVTWQTPVTVFASFRRDIQLTGDVTGTNGYVYLAAMDEGGGGAANRSNYMYRSTDGGATWNAGVLQNPPFAPPGSAVCSGNSYFYTMTPQIRHMGWGQPAAGPGGVLHYVYAQHGTGADPGDIYYVRSTDSGLTWGAPLKLNTDATLREQWMPSISSSPTGAVFVKWYDRRDTTNNDYWIYGRASLDNGVTWLADMTVSDAVIPQPIVQTANCYMGDYDYHSNNNLTGAGSNLALVTWTDSRGAGSGGTQDVFFDKVPLLQGTPTPTQTGTPATATRTRTSTSTPTVTPTPTCGGNVPYVYATSTGATIVAGTTFLTGSNCDDCVNTITLPFPFRLYDQVFNSVGASSNGNLQFLSADTAYTNTCLPDTLANYAILGHWDDLLLTGTNQGIYYSTSGTAPNRIFNIETTGGYFSGGGTIDFEVRLYENSVATNGRIDVIYGTVTQTGSSATVGVQKDTGSQFTQFECNTGGLAAGLMITFTQPPCNTAGPTATGGTGASPTRTVTQGPQPTATCVSQPAAWVANANLPTVLVRGVGVFWPTTGHFLSVGGRTADTAGSDFQHVLDYNPGTNTWTQNASLLPDNSMNNMACGVLTVSGTPQIYCVGGSFATGTTANARVFAYNPATDTSTVLAAGDNWPGDAAGTILPGGFVVANNKLYILGGFNINVASTNQIWEFDPTMAVGSKWLQRVNAPVGIMYAPTAYSPTTGLIYVLAASDYSGGTVIDTTNGFSFNPTTNMTGSIAAIPRATGETRAVRVPSGNLWVLGGGRVAPNPSTQVDVYNPGTNLWSTALPFLTARRNFPADSDPATGRVWTAGGYDSTGVTATAVNEDYQPALACNTPTVGPTQPVPTNTQPVPPTATQPSVASATRTQPPVPTNTQPVPPTNTQPPVPTATHCALPFTDTAGTTFESYIRCLWCRGIISGYSTSPPCASGQAPCFQPDANITRGQVAKMIANAAGFTDVIPTSQQTFTDIPYGHQFWLYIERLYLHAAISGYSGNGQINPCTGLIETSGNLYFRACSPVTRGQFAKIDSIAAGYPDVIASTQQTFQDVDAPSTGNANPFWLWIERVYLHNVISGYIGDGVTINPCTGNTELLGQHYFRPCNFSTRGQASKIVANTFYPNCVTPSRPTGPANH